MGGSQSESQSGSDRGSGSGHDPALRQRPSGCSTLGAGLTPESRHAAKQYLQRLGPELRRRHGAQRHYTPAQVERAGRDLGLWMDWHCLAWCLFCTPGDFSSVHESLGEVCDYGSLHAALAGAFFNGHLDFDPMVVAEAISTGTIDAVIDGFRAAGDWLADIDWPDLFDWS